MGIGKEKELVGMLNIGGWTGAKSGKRACSVMESILMGSGERGLGAWMSRDETSASLM